MKRATLIWLITAGILVLLGCAVFTAVLAVNGWDFTAIGNVKYQTKTVLITDEFSDISIDFDTEDIVFADSVDGDCKVEFYESEKEKHTAVVADNTLSIEKTDTREWYEHLSFSLNSPKITVYLPKIEYGSLHINGSTGDVSIPGGLAFETIDISVSTGDVKCSASSLGSMRIKTGTGDISGEYLTAKELELSVTTGRIKFGFISDAGDIRLNVSTGKATLSNVRCKNLSSTGSTGDIKLEHVICSDKMTIKRSTGDVGFEYCDAAQITVETDTGNVTGTFNTEKIFIAHSDTGDVEVPKSVVGGKCEVTTDTGDIKLSVG